eukprot:m.107422 g.107422  ORF g.107422 m.107422 type:complete len:260 (-) comp16922_c0_seq1:245-1024(-)
MDVHDLRRDPLNESVARLDDAAERLRTSARQDDCNTSAYLKEKITRFQDKVDDLNRSVDELCSEIAIDKELSAANKLREDKAEMKRKLLEEEMAAENNYLNAKAKVEAEIALDRSMRQRRREEEELETLRAELEVRRKARENAEIIYSSDLANTIRRLRERELDLESVRANLTTSYERRRLHDAIRRIRLGRLSLAEQVYDYDYRGRRLARALDTPPLYTGLATRYYSDLYPYYSSNAGSAYRYPYYGYAYGYPYSYYY